MRRKDREMPKEYALSVIDNAEYGVLATIDSYGNPYTIPLSIVREGNSLYFHSAKAGKKVELLPDGKTVSLSFVDYAKVPYIFSKEEVVSMMHEKKYRELANKVYTSEFSSAHVEGLVYKIYEKEAQKALKLLCKKYTPEIYDITDDMIYQSLAYTQLYKIEIKYISGKRKKISI